MFYYLYQITNLVNNKIYIGVHKTVDINDGYMGSGKVIRDAIKKYGIDNFKKDILEYFDTSDAMYAKEKQIVTDEFLLREDVYNLALGGHGGFDYLNKTRLNLSGHKKSYKKRREILAKNSSLGTKTRNAKHGIAKFQESAKTSFLGKTHSEEAKKKIGVSNSKIQRGSGNSQFGTMWITDGVTNKKIKNNEIIPCGWFRGRS